MKISDVMTQNPKTAKPTDSLQTVAQIMRDEDVGVVPVVEGGRVIGMVTDRDIVIRAIADGDYKAKISDVVSGDVVTTMPDMPTSEAAELMGEHQIRRLAVVDGDDRLVGIVSLGDLAVKEKRDTRMGETLEHISEGVKRH